MGTTDATAGSDLDQDGAWAAFVEAARTMCELAEVGLWVVHLDEVPPRAEMLVESGAMPGAGDRTADVSDEISAAAHIIQAANESRERTGPLGPGGPAAPWFAVPWSDTRALLVEAAAARICAWAEREVGRFRGFAHADAALDAIGEGLVVLDGAQRVAHCTHRAAELLEVSSPAAIEGLSARELMPYVVDRLEPNEVARGTIDPTKKVTYVAHQLAPRVGHTESRPGLVVRLRSDARFQETRRGQRQLLSALRHDVRSPLTALRGLVSVLQEEPDMPRDERQSLLELLQQEAERTVTWVEDYLVLLRLRFEPRPLSPVSMSPDAPLRALHEELAHHARDRGVTFGLEVQLPSPGSGALPVAIEADMSLVDPFCKNLVGHFLRLADRGANVRIVIDQEGTLVVEGSGPGLFAQHPANPFTTLARSTAAGKRTPGVGLGLFLSKKVADVHGWPIAITMHDGLVRAVVRWTRPS